MFWLLRCKMIYWFGFNRWFFNAFFLFFNKDESVFLSLRRWDQVRRGLRSTWLGSSMQYYLLLLFLIIFLFLYIVLYLLQFPLIWVHISHEFFEYISKLSFLNCIKHLIKYHFSRWEHRQRRLRHHLNKRFPQLLI